MRPFQLLALAALMPAGLTVASGPAKPLFYRDVLPILRNRCQECHRPGEIGPMPLLTYAQARPWAKAIRDAVLRRTMPPWFAHPHIGVFSNDRSLTENEIETLANWAATGAPAGDPAEAPAPRPWVVGWQIGKPDRVIPMPDAIPVPSGREVDYQFMIVPHPFDRDTWVQDVELRPGNRSVVHHAVIYLREPGSDWLRNRPANVPFTAPEDDPESVTTSDILFTYTPGNGCDSYPPGVAKLIPAGSDLIFQMHYTPARRDVVDRSEIGFVFSKNRPQERILSLQLATSRMIIPPGDPDSVVTVAGTLPRAARLLSVYPHMHYRGKSFRFVVTPPGGRSETVLQVSHYNFYWQLNYRLAKGIALPAGTRLLAEAHFDNSRNNPLNPDPEVAVHYGRQSTDEMMVAFFDVAAPAGVGKQQFFVRSR